MDDDKTSTRNLWLRIVVFFFVVAAFFFIPAGTLDWPEGWLFLALYLGWGTGNAIWLQKNNPDLLRERMRGPIQEGQKSWDKVFVLVAFPVFIAMMVLPGLDAVRFGWSDPPLALQIAGFVMMIPAMVWLFLVTRENTFLAKTVKIQEGHTVISTGPYGVVRHPMYMGVMVFMIAQPLGLGSFYALIPAGIFCGLFVVRTALEDGMLHDEAPRLHRVRPKGPLPPDPGCVVTLRVDLCRSPASDFRCSRGPLNRKAAKAA